MTTDGWSRCESRELVEPAVLSGNAVAQRIKATLGITGLSLPRVHIDGVVCTCSECRLIASWVLQHFWAPKGWAVRP